MEIKKKIRLIASNRFKPHPAKASPKSSSLSEENPKPISKTLESTIGNSVAEDEAPYNESKSQTKVESPPPPIPKIQTPTGAGVSSLSLSSILLKKEAQQVKAKVNPEEVLEEKFDFDQFKIAWDQYAQLKQEKGLSNIAALFSIASLSLESPNRVHVKVPSAINKVELEREFFDLKPFLTKQLGNNQIEFDVAIAPEKNKEYLITTEEKYKKLLEINPIIAELRKKLDLDF
jgi:DNA polymerase-3 subunit gamma/tau